MAYLVERNDRFHVVVYDGIDPLTGKKRRAWQAAGTDCADAEAMLARIEAEQRLLDGDVTERGLTVGRYLRYTWLPAKRLELRPTTAMRYEWMIVNYVQPAVGDVLLRRLRVDHLEALYRNLLSHGRENGDGLAPKTVHNAHAMIRSALRTAQRRRLVTTNVADAAVAPKYRSVTPPMRSWTVDELTAFLAAARGERFYPAFAISAMTGMRRCEVLGLRWSAFEPKKSTLTVYTAIQLLGTRIIETHSRTRSSRRTVDLDPRTCDLLKRYRRQQRASGDGVDARSWMFRPSTASRSTPTCTPRPSTGSSPASTFPASGCMTCATPTPRCSLRTAKHSRSSPNDSATRTRRSP
jgi:integrase